MQQVDRAAGGYITKNMVGRKLHPAPELNALACYMYGGAITLQGVTNKDIIRIEQPQQDKQSVTCMLDL
jgi:hypothetical protein